MSSLLGRKKWTGVWGSMGGCVCVCVCVHGGGGGGGEGGIGKFDNFVITSFGHTQVQPNGLEQHFSILKHTKILMRMGKKVFS